MDTAVRRHLPVALIAGSVIAVSPIAPPTPPAIHAANLEIHLVNSVANIPINLFYALANVPYSELQAINHVAGSLFHTGTWFNGSSTNMWGEDPADPSHFESIANLLIPFPAFSNTFGWQLGMIAAAELPADGSCSTMNCYPVTPTEPITGITGLDMTLQFAVLAGKALSGQESIPLFDNWFQVSFDELMSGYEFGTRVNPDGPSNATQYGDYSFPGTHEGPNGEPLLPWSDTTFTWEPLEPFENFYDSLTATPSPIDEAIQIPAGEEVIRAFQALTAGLVIDFYPFIKGSPLCAEQCDLPEELHLTVPDIVRYIEAAYPGNVMINQWLQDVEDGTANGPTDEQRARGIQLLQTGYFTFDPTTTKKITDALAEVHPLLPDIVTDVGLLENFDENGERYGGWRPNALTNDIAKLLGLDVEDSTAPTDQSDTSVVSDAHSRTARDALAERLAALARFSTNQEETQQDSVTSIPSVTPTTVIMDVKAASDTQDGQAPANVFTPTQQDGDAFVRAATEKLKTAFASKPVAKPKPTASETDGNKVGGQSGERRREPATGLGDAVKSVNDRINSSISKVAGGLTGGNKTGETGTGDTKAGEGGIGDTDGGRHRAE
jgi:hypothetical protein